MKRLHVVFNVALLDPYTKREGFQPPAAVDVADEQQWEFGKIIDTRKRKSIQQWLVCWVGRSADHDSWQTKEDLQRAQQALDDFQMS